MAQGDLFSTTAATLIPDQPTLPKLSAASADCTQTVFGEGPKTARVFFVGEQPGDQEDLQGRPFVGPAGQLLDRALEEAGIDRSQACVTNVVKHLQVT